MFDYDNDMKDHESESYGIDNDIMYHDSKENPLLNDFGFYLLSRLPTFQNLKALRVDADMDISEYVRHSTELLDGSKVYRFSRELLAFFETMVAFSPYHVANNPNVAGPMDTFYETALARYKKVPYDKLHDFIEEGLVDWYLRFKPDAPVARSDDDDGAEKVEVNGEEQDDEAEAGPRADNVTFSLKRKSNGAQAAAAPSAAAAEAGAATAGRPRRC